MGCGDTTIGDLRLLSPPLVSPRALVLLSEASLRTFLRLHWMVVGTQPLAICDYLSPSLVSPRALVLLSEATLRTFLRLHWMVVGTQPLAICDYCRHRSCSHERQCCSVKQP